MKKKLILNSVIVTLIIINSFVIYLLAKPDDSKRLEEVNTKDLLSNNKSIAIMVQDSEGDEWHEADNRDSWPNPTTHGYVGAECTDSDGKEINAYDILKFDLSTYHATIDTKNSIYCTLYFAKGEPALQKLQETGGEVFAGGGDHTTAVDGMYRYKGTTTAVNNNYICFGTSDKTECLANPDTYMFRIIGITSEERIENNGQDVMWKKGQLKVIKATPSSESQAWASSDQTWDSSSAKSHVTTWYNTNISGKQPNGTYWDSIVTEQKWYNVTQTSTPGTVEPTTSQSAVSKVALMYGTDYKNSGDQNTNNWLYVKNGWSTSSTLSGYALYEWTISSAGYYGTYLAWAVYDNGILSSGYGVGAKFAVRPVFYLQSEINLTGTGKSDDPFRITTKIFK